MMTAEPSAADVKRALPYAQQPRYASGSGPAPAMKAPASRKAKASAMASRADDQENRRRQPAQQSRQQQNDGDEEDDEEEDDEEDDDEDDRPLKPSGAANAGVAGKKSKGKASEEDSSAKSADDDEDKKNTATKKSRRELPPHTVAILKGWMLSPEHVKHPYPTDEDKQMLLKKTGINMKQLTNWFTNARKRIWKPMMRREHSRQLQSAMEYEKARPREAFNPVPGAPQPPFRDGEFPPPRAMVSQSFDAGSLGPPRHAHQQQPPFDPYVRGVEGREAPLYPQQPPPHTFPPRVVRSASEALPRTDMDDYIDAMRIRKRVHERSPDGVEADALGPSDKRYRRSAIMSPRSLKILQDWVNAHSHLEYPFPTDPEKLQLSRDTGLDVQQIEMWFKNNRERIGAANFAIQNGAPGLSPSRRSLPGRSIPSRDNSMFPPRPGYGERPEPRSIPTNGNPMFPPRPAAPMQRSSVPGSGNPQFPPPPGRREMPEGYNYPSNGPPSHPSYGSGQYSGHPGYGAVDPARQVRSMSINAGQFMRPQPRLPQPVGAPGAGPNAPGAAGLPSLSNRGSVIGRAAPGPTMGQPRDGRSHTLDMGLFTDARRRKMNFQDILASTASSAGHHHPSVSRPLSSVGMPERSNDSNGPHPHSVGGNTENVYSNAMQPAYGATVPAGQKSFERPHIGAPTPGCPRCGMRLGSCGCNASEDQQQLRRIV